MIIYTANKINFTDITAVAKKNNVKRYPEQIFSIRPPA